MFPFIKRSVIQFKEKERYLMIKTAHLISLIALFISFNCTDNVSGSAHQGEAKVIGIVHNDDNKPVGGSTVYLLPSDHNPITDSISIQRAASYSAVTDDSGKFAIPSVESGAYVLNGYDSINSLHIYNSGILVESEDINVGINKLKKNSFVIVTLSDSVINNRGFLYIAGTSFSTIIDTVNVITIAVPSDTIEITYLSNDSNSSKIFIDNIITTPGDTLDLSGTPQKPIISGNDSALINQNASFIITNQIDSLLYKFYWGNGDSSNWMNDSIYKYKFSSEGSYSIKAMAKTSSGVTLFSEWSDTFIVNILVDSTLNNDTVPTPTIPTGNDTVTQMISESFSTSIWGLDNSLFEFRFNWGDSTQSSWSSDTFATHTWSLDSVMYTCGIKAQARSKSDPSKISEWSGVRYVFVTF